MADGLPLSLYFAAERDELVDLEVAAAAAIEWARGMKAAAAALDDSYDYRVSLIAAEPGSSKWLAKIERSKANQAAERVKRGWEEVPLILRAAVGLAVVIPLTIVPTYEWWTDSESFSDTQLRQIRQVVEEVAEDPTVKAHRQRIYTEVQRDPKITGVAAGVADRPDWKPKAVVPANRFAEADGLFEPKPAPNEERTIYPVLDVVLVSPRLQNAPRVWTFRQEGIPGTFNATMKDRKFLAALKRSSVRERLRMDIAMRVTLEIKQEFLDGEWRVKPRGRSVVEVIYPKGE